MKALRKLAVVVVGVPLLLAAGAGVATLVRVDQATRPGRQAGGDLDFEMLMMEVHPLEYTTADGVPIAGWLVRGAPGRPAIVMGHDLGSNKTALATLASRLMREGFTLLLVDFRGHGESGGHRSTLGLNEKWDLLGALPVIRREGLGQEGRVGVYGVGIGAHAAVLAAAEDPAFKVLVLDAIHPDAGYKLGELVWSDWLLGRERLAFMSGGLFALLSRTAIDGHRASDVLPGLVGRDVLLLAPEGDARLAAAMKAMYNAIPQQTDADGNLVLLPATHRDGLYGDELAAYHERVVGFFRSRL